MNNTTHPSASDVMQRAEKAAREIDSRLEQVAMYTVEELAAIIARHFEDYQKLREALTDFVHNVHTHNIAGRGEWHTATDASFHTLQATLAATAPEGK